MKSLTTILMIAASPALAIDACMVGVWQADGADMAHVLGSQMGGSATHQGGTATLEITNTGVMTLLTNDMVFAIQVPDTPAMSITISGYSQGAMNADDGTTYVANATEYDLVGTANVLGQTMTVPVTSASGAGWGVSQGTYGCSGNTMSFDATVLGSMPRKFTKLR